MELHNLVLKEHDYARKDDFGCLLKPTKTLFQSSFQSSFSNEIDVTSVDPVVSPKYDAVKSLQLMEECERYAIFARDPRVEEAPDDWEECIPRFGWSLEQLTLFKRIVKILHEDRLARLALKDSWSEPAKRRAHVDRSAQQFREALATVQWDVHLTQWLHGLLVEHLDIGYLAAYVDILQTLKVRIPTLVGRLLAGAVYSNNKSSVVQQGMNLLLKRPWDPAVSTINAQKMGKLPGNPIIILVPSSLRRHPQFTPRCNLWSAHLSHLATVLTVVPADGTISPRMTPPAYLEQMVSMTKARIASARAEYPGRPTVLVGWRSGAAVALQVVTTERVAAAVSLGLATRTVEGPRGDPDDTIYNITCPVLFVTGEHATTARPEELEEIRAKMPGPTGLVVVGSSDDCLRMRRRQKLSLGVTQSLVDREILEAVSEFLAEMLLQPEPPSRIDRHQTAASFVGSLSRKRRLSTESSMESEESCLPPRPQSFGKQFRQRLSSPYRMVNGNSTAFTPTPARRGRKPGSLNKNPRIPKPVKTLQTLSPVKKSMIQGSGLESNRRSDVTVDVGSLASLTPIGPIVRTGAAQTHVSTAVSSTMQTFRIQAGRVSAASAPPADVIPPRLSESVPSSSLAQDDRLRDVCSPIMTLSRPNTVARPLRPLTLPAGVGSTSRTGPRLSLTTSSKIVPTQRNVVMMSDKRISSCSPNSVKLTATLKTSPSNMAKTHPINQIKTSPISQIKKNPASQMKTSPMGRLSITKRLVSTNSSPLQHKPIIVKSQPPKTNEDSDIKNVPFMIVKRRAIEDKEDKPILYLQCAGNEPVMIVKNRALALEGESKLEASEVDRHQQQESSAKHVGLPTSVLNYQQREQELIYQILDS